MMTRRRKLQPAATAAGRRPGGFRTFDGASLRGGSCGGWTVRAVSAPAPPQGLGTLGVEDLLLADPALHHDQGVRQLLDQDGR